MRIAKRVWPVLLACVLVMTAFSATAFGFTQRTSAPAKDNKYYYSSNNPFYSTYVGQCTWYAWGRAYEVSGKKPTLSTGNAGEWYSKSDGYTHDTKPSAGSVICWSANTGGAGGYGHVGFVEAVNSDGSVFISEFNWDTHVESFNTRTIKKGSNAYNAAKYIHIINPDPDPDDPPVVSKTQNVDPGVYTIKNVASGRYMNYAWGWKAFDYYPIMICDKDNSPEQNFELEHRGSGQYTLIIKHKDGGVVNIWRGSGNAQAGDPVSQYARNNSDPLQKFYLTKLSNGNYVIQCATDTSMVIAPESTSNQAYLKVFRYKANDTKQQWVLTNTDAEAAAKVKNLINAIGTVTLDSGDAIQNARAAYDALTNAQKALVPDDVKAKLEAAESEYEALVLASKEGWKKNSNGWWYQNADGTYPKNTWKKIDGKWYHFDSKGYMQTGWLKIDDTWYYLKSNGAMATGWQKIGSDWYYFNSNGSMAVNTWQGDYYLLSSGKMAKDCWIGDRYVDSSGKYDPSKVKAGWKKNSNGWWYQNEDGTYPNNAWKKIDGEWYHFDAKGYMQTGWLKINDTWYYLQSNGAMATGWLKIGSDYYYFNSNGSMAKDTWIGKYHVDENGIWDKTAS